MSYYFCVPQVADALRAEPGFDPHKGKLGAFEARRMIEVREPILKGNALRLLFGD